MDGWTDGKRLIGRQMDVGRDGQMEREMGRWVGAGMDRSMEGWMAMDDKGPTDEWIK